MSQAESVSVSTTVSSLICALVTPGSYLMRPASRAPAYGMLHPLGRGFRSHLFRRPLPGSRATPPGEDPFESCSRRPLGDHEHLVAPPKDAITGQPCSEVVHDDQELLGDATGPLRTRIQLA